MTDLLLDDESLATMLIEKQYGRWYDGRVRETWCPPVGRRTSEAAMICDQSAAYIKQWVEYAAGARWEGDKAYAEVSLEKLVAA